MKRMRLRGRAALIAAVLTLWAVTAEADPMRMRTPSTVTTDGGSTRRLPPGVFLPESDWQRLDTEMRRLQDTETRLGAENESLRKSVSDAPGWKLLLTTFTAGVSVGYLLTR